MSDSSLLRILYVGESWRGSSARSLREALGAKAGIELDDISEDRFVTVGDSWPLRGARRLLRRFEHHALARAVALQVHHFKPDVLLVYKGTCVSKSLLREMRLLGVRTANVYPDASPVAYGRRHAASVGEYDLVISTKPWHPGRWRKDFGYANKCVFVPHGYDPTVHYWPGPSDQQDIDIVLVATCRDEYGVTMARLGQLIPDRDVSCTIGGCGWRAYSRSVPSHWRLVGPVSGRAYGTLLRRGRIVIAPVTRHVRGRAGSCEGDQDSTRSYELAAAGTFFLHRATPYIRDVYREDKEVVLWDDVDELAGKIRLYLGHPDARRIIAEAAHRRAVPDYSIPTRANAILTHIRALVSRPARGLVDAEG